MKKFQMIIFTIIASLLLILSVAFAEPETAPAPGDQPAQLLRVESRIPVDVQRALAEAGHQVRVVKAFDGAVGHAAAIRINEQGQRSGGFDPRSDGSAIGW